MHYIVKLFPEITIKSPPVRKRFTKQVRDNLRKLLKALNGKIDVQRDWEKVEVTLPEGGEALQRAVEEVLLQTPGIANFSRVEGYDFETVEQIQDKTLKFWQGRLDGKTFCVRVKRSGNHSFRSVDVERQLGGALLAASPTSKVKLREPEITVALEVRGKRFFIVDQTFPGLGGFPIGSQDTVISLISGGFDSTVASFLTMKRGLRTHFCFFNLGGSAHELGVKEVASFIWRKYGASHRVQFVTVPFDGVVTEILTKVDNPYMGVILKRMMFRAAERVASELNCFALVSGESVGQVSSQTLPNLAVIDDVSDMLTLRPLVVMDKGDIINLSKKIGTEVFAANMPEYCGVISVKPTTRAKPERVLHEESFFDFAVLEKALGAKQIENVDELLYEADDSAESVKIYTTPQPGFTIVDIRHPDEIARKELKAGNTQIIEIPFYLLDKSASNLEPANQYLLYCDRGVMSRLHAELLNDKGHNNVGVYRPG